MASTETGFTVFLTSFGCGATLATTFSAAGAAIWVAG